MISDISNYSVCKTYKKASTINQEFKLINPAQNPPLKPKLQIKYHYKDLNKKPYEIYFNIYKQEHWI